MYGSKRDAERPGRRSHAGLWNDGTGFRQATPPVLPYNPLSCQLARPIAYMTESHNAATRRISAQLTERWPALFNAMKPVPLAVGIHAALHAAMPDITAGQLRRVLAPWCKRPRYLATLAVGADRHGLEGIQGTVTEAQAADAAEMLKAAQTRFRERAEAKRQAEKAMRASAKEEAEQAKAKEEAEPPPGAA